MDRRIWKDILLLHNEMKRVKKLLASLPNNWNSLLHSFPEYTKHGECLLSDAADLFLVLVFDRTASVCLECNLMWVEGLAKLSTYQSE